MTTYYLFEVADSYEPTGVRLCIDVVLPKDATLHAAPLECDTWLQAKQEFGFELTPTQAAML